MELGDLTLEVRDKNLKRVGVILPDEATFTLRDEFNNVGAWEIDLPLEHPLTNALRTPGAGIRVTGPAGVLLTGPMTEASSKGSRDDPEGMVNFKGVTDDVILNDYLAYPVPENPTMAGQAARANDIRTGKAETVMHQYVNANLGPGAPAARRCALLRLGANGGRGPDVHKSARFPMMGTLLTEIAVLGNLGYRVIQRGGNLVFETYAQSDKRKRIRMDLWNNTLASYELTVAGAAVTHVIVAGQEEGVDRQLVERTTAESLEQMALWGRRKEKFLDRRSTDEIAELEQAGDEVLSEQGIDQSIVKFVPMDETTMRYQVDWNIGDIVTAVIEGREIPAVVTAAIIKVDSNGVRVACALGDISATDERAEIRSFMAGTETRLSALERTAEMTTGTAPKTGVVAPYYTQGKPRIIWDGETSPSEPMPYLSTWRPASGDSVLGTLNKETGEWVVSPVATASVYTPRWYPLTLQNGWNDYSPASYATAGFTKTALGLVKLKGLIKGGPTGSSVIAQLPVGFRPANYSMFASQISTSGGTSGSIDIRTDGVIAARLTDPGWTSLENIAFWAVSDVPESKWTTATLQNSYTNFVDGSGGGWARASWYRDPHGVVWERGLVARAAAPASNTILFNVPYGPDKQMHRRTTANNAHAYLYKFAGGDTSNGTLAGSSYISLDGAPYVDKTSSLVWTPFTFENSWKDYNSNQYSPAGYTKTPDGVVHLRGLISAGTLAAVVTTLPAGYRPAERLLMGTVSNNATARADVNSNGQVTAQSGSNVWFSLDGLCFIADQ